MAVLTPSRSAPPTPDVQPRQARPVRVWALFGLLILAAEAAILIRWVTGPFFTRVRPGPSPVPGWMKAELMAWQTLSIPVALVIVFVFVVRPLLRHRRLGIDGLLVLAFCSLWFQDPISSYSGHWITYNSWMVNRGSWVNSIPGWGSFGKPGAMLVEPLGFTAPAYVYIFTLVMFLGSWVMRRTRRRFPRMGTLGLIATCFAAMFAFDLVLEAIVWLPLGVFEYPGGHWGLFASEYYKYPLHEGLTIGATFTAVACLRFFVNDRGQSIAERGIDEVRGGSVRTTVTRALAVTAAVQLGMFVLYTLPNVVVGMHSSAWPAKLQERSYLTDGLCGEGTDRACPGPGIPRGGPSDFYVRSDGTLGTPAGTTVPPVVPFVR